MNGERARPSGSLEVLRGIVQEKLPMVPNERFDLIIDVMDAFTYSSDRLNLLNLYYKKLRPGGRAYLSTDFVSDLIARNCSHHR